MFEGSFVLHVFKPRTCSRKGSFPLAVAGCVPEWRVTRYFLSSGVYHTSALHQSWAVVNGDIAGGCLGTVEKPRVEGTPWVPGDMGSL